VTLAKPFFVMGIKLAPSNLSEQGSEFMSLNLFKDKGIPLEKQVFTWRDLVQKPISKLNDDAFTNPYWNC